MAQAIERKKSGASENDMVSASITLPTDLLNDADRRAAELDLSRSQYFRKLAREDLKGAKAGGKAA